MMVQGMVSQGQDSTANRSTVFLENGRELEAAVYSAINRNRDSLNSLQLYGHFFLRFNIDKTDLIVNVKSSNSAPDYLAEIIETSLKGKKLIVSNNLPDSTIFVLPIFFNFKRDLVRTPSVSDGVPTLDLNRYMNTDGRSAFERFFDLEIEQGKKSAVICVMLPWIKYVDWSHPYN